MITPNEFVRRWGNVEDLIRYDAAHVESLAIPDVSKTFLMEAGLPKRTMGTIFFDLPPNKLPRLPSAISELESPEELIIYGRSKVGWRDVAVALSKFTFPEEYSRYRLFGLQIFPDRPEEPFISCMHCFDEEEDGQVVIVSNPWPHQINPLPVVLLNTTLPQMAEMFLLDEEEQRWRTQWIANHPKNEDDDAEDETDPDAEKYDHMKEVAAAMRLVDPVAMKKGFGWENMIFSFEIGMP